jgi:nucleoside-diphosphate-sugar epimerase
LESLLTVASSAKVIYNCANPPYNSWVVEWPKISSSVSEFAMRTGADLVICSNLYGYGPHEGVLTEDFPLKATWANGVARAKVWQENKALNDAEKLRVTEVRGSDYICANEQSRMGDRVVPNLIAGKPIQLLGAIDQPHTWTDPDDVAKLMLTLAEDNRSWGRPWHVPSNEPKTQREVVADIAKELGVTDYKVAPVGILLESILGVFNPVIRELNRGRYQFAKPYVVSSKAAQETFGLSPKPWNQVIADLVMTYKTDNQKGTDKQ